MRLGIDFGTTRTVVAAAQDGRYPTVRFETDDAVRDYVPGLAGRGPEGGLRFGWEAVSSVPRVRSIKRLVGDLAPDAPVAGLGGEVTALELLTGFLSALHRTLRERSSLEPDPDEPLEAMVAVPASASGAQRFLTLEAFRRAGFEVLGLLNEPTAAGIEFAHRHLRGLGARSPKRFVVIYDLGGGTFDASAVALAERRFELLANEGIGRLGGDDFDAEILVLALEMLGMPLEAVDLARSASLLERCREAKENLAPGSRQLLVDVSEDVPGAGPTLVPTDELYQRCEPLVARSLECLERLFEEMPAHGIDPERARELAAVYVAGGSAVFPPVLRALRARYGRKLKIAPEPHAATAVGLAVAADPAAAVFVREATTRHLGVWREREGGREKVFDRIVSKGELPPEGGPLVLERSYRPAHRVGHLRFVHCTDLTASGEPAGELTPVDEVLFPYDPGLVDRDLRDLPVERTPEAAAEEIVETYVCAPDGRVSVAIENRSRGYRREYRLGERGRPAPTPAPPPG